jgi:tetratricopeptide (TPR) repeat protein
MRSVLSSLIMLLVPGTVAAQSSPSVRDAAPVSSPAASSASSSREVTPFQAALNRGAQAFRERQFDAAATAFRDAAARDPRSPLPQLLLGAVAQAQGNTANALGAYREAARIAQAEGDDASRGRALAAIASVHEGQQRWDDARNAWQEYVAFADAHAQVTFPTVGRARLDAIARRTSLEAEYAPVRERIAERLRVNASGQNQQAPPGAAVPSGAWAPSGRPR